MPFPRDDPTLSRCFERDRDSAFLDQHFLPGVLTIPVCIDPSSKFLAVVRVGRCSLWRSRALFPVAMVLARLPVVVAPVLIGPATMSQTRGWNENDDQPDQ